jgi:hypothetical protein
MPITSTDRGSGWRSIGMWPDISWVAMSMLVPASSLPLTRRKTCSPPFMTETVPLVPSR